MTSPTSSVAMVERQMGWGDIDLLQLNPGLLEEWVFHHNHTPSPPDSRNRFGEKKAK